jgi:hypothetical protein
MCREKSSELKDAVVEFTSRLGSTYRDIQSTMVTAIHDSVARGESIASSCNDVLSHLQFQDRVQQRLLSAKGIMDLWRGIVPLEGDAQEAIQRLRVGTERLTRVHAPGASARAGADAPGSLRPTPSVDAGELNFL